MVLLSNVLRTKIHKAVNRCFMYQHYINYALVKKLLIAQYYSIDKVTRCCPSAEMGDVEAPKSSRVPLKCRTVNVKILRKCKATG